MTKSAIDLAREALQPFAAVGEFFNAAGALVGLRVIYQSRAGTLTVDDFIQSEKALAALTTEQSRVPTDRERVAKALDDAADISSMPSASAMYREAAAFIRQSAPAEVEVLTRPIGQTLGLFASVIKSGEPWTDVCEEEYNKALAALATLRRIVLSAVGDWRPTHRHYKGGLYREIARGRIEADQSPVVIYDNEKGETWVRPVDNFDARIGMNHIPRFEMLPAPPIPEEPGR